MWTTRLAAIAGTLVAVGLSLATVTIGIVVGSSLLPTMFWISLMCATVIPAVIAAWVAVPIGKAVYQWLRSPGRLGGKGIDDNQNV